MKYKITIGGIGSEVFVHKLNDEQVKKLRNLGVDNPIKKYNLNDIENAIDKDVDESDIIFVGPYNNPNDYYIEVHDENGDLIWESEDSFYFENMYDNEVFYGEKILIVDDYVKGKHFDFFIEDSIFDPLKLVPIITDIGGRIQIVTGFIYNGEKIQNQESLDNRSNGISFYLND